MIDRVKDESFEVPECVVIEEDAEETLRQPMTFLQALLFPFTWVGLAHIIMFTAWIWLLLEVPIDYFEIALVSLVVLIKLINYLYDCVRESACGRTKAPNCIFLPSADCAYTILPVLICILPAVLYYIFNDRLDYVFFGLASLGVFYFPMFILSATLFESSSGLNPSIHMTSIVSTFSSYCLLVIQYLIIVLLCSFGCLYIGQSWIVNYIVLPATLYFTMVYCALLGRFYCKNESKLRWDV